LKQRKKRRPLLVCALWCIACYDHGHHRFAGGQAHRDPPAMPREDRARSLGSEEPGKLAVQGAENPWGDSLAEPLPYRAIVETTSLRPRVVGFSNY
jgi:hypothetical protein